MTAMFESRDTTSETPRPARSAADDGALRAVAVAPAGWKPGVFEHERLDAFVVARQALHQGDKLARRLPRGYGSLSDQLRRALLSAYLGVAEAASRTGADRAAR